MSTKMLIFLKGAGAAGLASVLFMLQNTLHDLIFLYPVKIIATVTLAFFGGITNVIAREMFEKKIKNWINKKKNNGEKTL